MRVFITVDLGWGDSGKGATVDFLSRVPTDGRPRPIVIRYSGGPQCSHAVHTKDGRSHRFHQYGSGTFAGARTYISEDVVVDPITLVEEAQELIHLGCSHTIVDNIVISKNCLVTTKFHQKANQIKEASRSVRHGSCGFGVGETRAYHLKYGQGAIFMSDLAEPSLLYDKLLSLKKCLLNSLYECVDPEISSEDLQKFANMSVYAVYKELAHLHAAAQFKRKLVDRYYNPELGSSNVLIFEGAQGVLLDEYHGFPPHNTWSTVTSHNAFMLLNEWADTCGSRYFDNPTELYGITRAYATRHGDGPMPSRSEYLTEVLKDPNNPANTFQGTLRCGWLDIPLLKYAKAVEPKLTGIIVNHLDQVIPGDFGYVTYDAPVYGGTDYWAKRSDGGFIIGMDQSSAYARSTQLAGTELRVGNYHPVAGPAELLAVIAEELKVPVVLTATGPTAEDRVWLDKATT